MKKVMPSIVYEQTDKLRGGGQKINTGDIGQPNSSSCNASIIENKGYWKKKMKICN